MSYYESRVLLRTSSKDYAGGSPVLPASERTLATPPYDPWHGQRGWLLLDAICGGGCTWSPRYAQTRSHSVAKDGSRRIRFCMTCLGLLQVGQTGEDVPCYGGTGLSGPFVVRQDKFQHPVPWSRKADRLC